MPRRRLPLFALLLSVALAAPAAAGCAPGGSAAADGAEGLTERAGRGGDVRVVASFYPLAFAAQQVGGDHVTVTNLTRSGVEPHDLELTPTDVIRVAKARLVIYEKGFQPAVDEAVASQATRQVLDVAPAARLDLALQEPIGESETEHVGEPAAEGEAEHSGRDPHFWLDPARYADVARAVGASLTALDPQHAADYERQSRAFTDRLAALRTEYAAGLKACRTTALVTSHAAFGYLARANGLTQVAINGVSPESEPDPGQLAAVATFVRAHGVTTVYAETLVSKATARTVAAETGARVAVLDPVEGLTEASAGHDYFEVMRSNLASLRAGQGCS